MTDVFKTNYSDNIESTEIIKKLPKTFLKEIIAVRSQIIRRLIGEEKTNIKKAFDDFIKEKSVKLEKETRPIYSKYMIEKEFFEYLEEKDHEKLKTYARSITITKEEANTRLPLYSREKINLLYKRIYLREEDDPKRSPLPLNQDNFDLYSSAKLDSLGKHKCAIFQYKYIFGMDHSEGEPNCNNLIARIMMRNEKEVETSGIINPMDLLNMPEEMLPKTQDGRLMIALMHGDKAHDYHIGLLTDIITIKEGGEEIKLFCELHEQDGVEYSIFSPEGKNCPKFNENIKEMYRLDKLEKKGELPEGSTERFVKTAFPPAFMNLFIHRRDHLEKLQFKKDRKFFGVRSKQHPKGEINMAVNVFWPKPEDLPEQIDPELIAQE